MRGKDGQNLIEHSQRHQQGKQCNETYNCGNGEDFLVGIVEELQHIVTDDDTGLAGENVLDTHFRIVSIEDNSVVYLV